MSECSICSSQLLDPVNAALDQGKSIREIAREFNVPKSTVHRHSIQCRVLAEARKAVTLHRAEVKEAQLIQSTAERLAPIDDLARNLMDFIAAQIERGKPPNLSLVRTWLQAQETTLKAQALLEQRQGASPMVSGLTEAGRTVSFLAEHFPDALAALRTHLEAQA